ncbi:DUF3597 domain-containing protein [Stutzerimonas stutzeri]|uniref:Oxidoreductase n=1 Tax=Stutzerimonas stutzeri TaxID=316 RepID=A0A2N8RF52_STUST|nr:DUF3597 domain-containing protein [Stutzerimonas stutzeri]MCQ4254079.1 DUF3597 domain-containing protein [Stutzerimonas stutzeri]MDH2246986.1 DUF3597 domain-containing protein [Pseudomonas sp. GD03856]MDH2265774.1 DUF3597 domain-containing protein [Pseudomonas sp. GD03855]PNF59716.1 oxidoreductase [Stutzerimonas stutzeri]
MGLFDSIKAKLGLGDVSNEAQRKADVPAADATHSSAEGITLSNTPTTTDNATIAPHMDLNQSATTASGVDVVAQLEAKAAQHLEALNWRSSIVDLLKLLGLDSSMEARRELATELGCPPAEMADSAQMNMWLHRAVMKKLAENGGSIPPELLH